MIKGTHGSRWYTHSSSRCRCDNTIFMLFSGLGELQFFRCGLLLPSTCAMCCKDTTINEWQQEISFTKIKRQVSQRGKSPTWFWLWLLFFFFFGFWQSCRILLLAYFSFFFISLFRSMEHDDHKHTYITHIFMHIMIIISLRVVFVFCVSGTRRWISFAWPPLKARIVCKFQVSMRTLNCEGNPRAIWSGSDWSYPSRGMQDNKGISLCTLHIANSNISKPWTLFDWFIILYYIASHVIVVVVVCTAVYGQKQLN